MRLATSRFGTVAVLEKWNLLKKCSLAGYFRDQTPPFENCNSTKAGASSSATCHVTGPRMFCVGVGYPEPRNLSTFETRPGAPPLPRHWSTFMTQSKVVTQ